MIGNILIFLMVSAVVHIFPAELYNNLNQNEKLVFPEIEGLTIEYNYPVYTGEDLWDYINGASDGYMSYHFERLDIAEYKDAHGNVVKVEIYKHRRPEDAYGIYSTERSPDYQFIDIGTEGYAENNLVYFVTGPYYVKVIAAPGSETSPEELKMIADTVSKFLVESPSPPLALAMLPQDGMIPHTERFVATNVLGHEFLRDFFMADYQTEGQDFTLMLFSGSSATDALELLENYYKYTREEMPEQKSGYFIVNDKYNGTIYFYLKGKVLAGFMGLKDKTVMDAMIQKIAWRD